MDILSPVAPLPLTRRPPSRRPAKLRGAHIALVDNQRPAARVILDAARRHLEGLGARITVVPKRHGSAPLDDAQQKRIRRECQAVVFGVGDHRPSALYAGYEAASLEREGVPAVVLCTADSPLHAQVVATSMGVPGLPVIVASPSANEWLDALAVALIEAPEALDAAYQGRYCSRAQAEAYFGLVAHGQPMPTGTVRVGGGYDGINTFAARWRWSDGLPIFPPTPERVAAMVVASRRAPDDVVALVPPRFGEATVERVAANAVMAGCHPREMPALIAAAQALSKPGMNAFGLLLGTGPQAPMVCINGPARKALEVNCRHNVLGAGRAANGTIARALRFVIANIGGCIPEVTDLAAMGSPAKYAFCFGENEEESAWPGLHTTRGLPKEASAVTVALVRGVFDISSAAVTPDDIVKALAQGMSVRSTANLYYGGEMVLLLCLQWAKTLQAAGVSRADLQRRLFEALQVPLSSLTQPDMDALRAFRSDEFPDLDTRSWAPPVRGPDDILVIVTGGAPGPHSACCPTSGGLSWSQTVRIADGGGAT
ncbi:MAG: hypothetical protein Q7T26_01980 [Dehalococcoidia bacterium]|nr:hypothetical protein [Dehalococcoidia bacterium]